MDSNQYFSFSILIPCYNYAHYLAECLQSVLDQSVLDWEAIVVDDASTQGDPEAVVQQFHDPRIRFFRHDQNRGAGATFNTAFKHSQYPYVTLLSADDTLDPDFLENIQRLLLEKADVDVVSVDIQLFGEKSAVWHYDVRDAKAMTLGQWIPGAASVMKRSVWENAGGHYEGPELKGGNLDWDFWLSAVAYPLQVVHISRVLYHYRVHSSSITSKRANWDVGIHEFMFLRHQPLFDRYGTGPQFISIGYYNGAVAAWQNHEYLTAAELARTAWKLYPHPENAAQSADVFSLIRTQFENEGVEIQGKRRALEQKIATAPDSPVSHSKENVFAYRDLARLATAQDDWEAAEKYLVYAIAFMKNTVAAAGLCNLLGLVYIKKNDLEAALQAFSLTLHFDPTNRGVYLHKAFLLFKMGRVVEALPQCVNGLMLLPTHKPLWVLLGQIATLYEEQGRDLNELNTMVQSPVASSLPISGDRSFLYHSPLGRKIYWIFRAQDLYDKYGTTQGGFDTLAEAIQVVSPRSVLEIGCGNGRNFPLYASMNITEVVGQDISSGALLLAKKRHYPSITLTETPITQLKYPKDYFDLIVSNRVLQHIPADSLPPIMEAICWMSRFIYINEATPREVGESLDSFYMFIHDYKALFAQYHFNIIREMPVENQWRYLFGKTS